MNIIHRKRRALFAALLVIAGAGVVAGSTQIAQADDTGATATKNCVQRPVDNPYTVGDVVPCGATFINAGLLPAQITSLTEQAPFIANGNPGNGPVLPLSCSTDGGTTTKTVGDTLDPGSMQPPNNICATAFSVAIPNNPALCNTFFRDRVEIELLYASGLTAGAFATNTVRIVCHPSITVVKTADATSKVTDPVNYNIKVCNTSLITVTKTSVSDSLIPGVDATFGATLAPGACEDHNFARTVVAGDPDPLINTATATYTNGIAGIFAESVTQSAQASTNLFTPGVDVTKTCGPNPAEVGGPENCTIVVTNTSSSDAPALTNGTISDSLTGNLLDPANTAVTSNTCTGTLGVGSCSITTTRTILATDPNPVVNTVTVHFNPLGFPNDITDSASASVNTVVPVITVTKSADATSKPTDAVTYSVTVCNAGVIDVAPNSVTDTLQGNLTAQFGPLTPGACQTVGYSRVVLVSDPDPLINTVTATFGTQFQSATATASATTNLFQPGVGVTKTCGPNPIQVGQAELCQIVVTNLSSSDAPNLVNGTIGDTLSGNLLTAGNPNVVNSNCAAVLPTLGSCTINTSRVVLAGDPNPLVNTVSVHYNPDGFPNSIDATASATVGIVGPAISVTKTGDALSKITDPVNYHIEICNTGIIPVTRTSVNDSLIGDIASSFAAQLAPGACTAADLARTVVVGDPDPLVNTVTAVYSGVGASASATAQASTNLFQPSLTASKNCSPDPITVGQTEVCTIVLTNTSSADAPALIKDSIVDSLTGAANPAGCATLTSGSSCTFITNRVVLATDVSPLVNTVVAHYHPSGFPNDITASAFDSVVINRPVTNQCTLGFWKQSQHFWAWHGYTPTQSFNTVFGTNITLNAQGKTPAISNPTLLQALQAGGGGVNDLARHAVAALLNSSSLQNPTFSTAQVIALTKAAYTAGGAAITAQAAAFDREQNADNCSAFINIKR